MFNRVAGFLACCSLTSGFLLPPNVKAATPDSVSDLSLVSVNTKSQILELPCRSCAFAVKTGIEEFVSEDDTLWIQGGANNLILNFTISENGRALELNGLPIYPIQDAKTMRDHDLYVDQVAATTSRKALESGEYRAVPLRVTSSGLSFEEPYSASTNEQVVPIKWRVLELEGQTMEVDDVGIQLLKVAGDELLILSAEPLHEDAAHDPAAILPHRPTHGGAARPHPPPPKDCGLFCRFLHMLGNKIEDVKHSKVGAFAGCSGPKGPPHRLPGHIKPHLQFDSRPHGPPHGPPRPHGPPHGPPHERPHGPPGRFDHPPHMHPHGPHGPHGGHGRHGRHHGHHHFLASFVHGFMSILVPVLSGLAMGLFFCISAMMLNRFIVWFWISVVRKGEAPTSERSKNILLSLGWIETRPVVDEEGAPPVYEDAPVYELMSEKDEQKEPLLSEKN